MSGAAESRKGVLAGVLAYAIWGLFPLYFKQVAQVSPLEVVAHRSLWSLAFLAIVLLLLRRWGGVLAWLAQPRVAGKAFLAAVLLVGNWTVYVWAVVNGHVLEASLGYFINPLVNVALGYAVLHERPRRMQWLAVALAACGVVWLALHAGRPPWVALTLALSFGFYGLLRKTTPMSAIDGLAVETILFAPVAIAALAWWTMQGSSSFVQGSASELAWLVGTGPLTAIPLLLFAVSARRVTLTTLGLLQYIAPSMLFLQGALLFDEPVSPARLVGFALIWAALALYTLDGLRQR